MSLNAQSRRLLGLVAGLSTAGNVTADFATLTARTGFEPTVLRSLLAALMSDGLITEQPTGVTSATDVAYGLTLDGWDVVDDMAAVNPRADLDEKQREYSRATALVNRFTQADDPASPGAPLPTMDGSFAAALHSEDIAKHRYNRALSRYLERARVPMPAR